VAVSGVQIFVQLGKIPDFAFHFIVQARQVNPHYRTVLVTDQRAANLADGVEVVRVDQVVSAPEISQLANALRSSQYDLSWRKGYWLRVFLRFLVLRNYCASHQGAGPFVHFECDVASYATRPMLEEFLTGMLTPSAMPFIDDATACPGIVLATSAQAMATLADMVIQDVLSGAGRSDMESLAKARAVGLLEAMPTKAQDARTFMKVLPLTEDGQRSSPHAANIIFDAASVGQYLFGIDPRNNGGILIPGYREPRGGMDPGDWSHWGLAVCEDGITRVTFRDEGQLGVLANLHVHAKAVIPRPSGNCPNWTKWLDVANGVAPPSRRILISPFVRHLAPEAIRKSRRALRRLHNRAFGSG
jgi:hypothetical protein